MKILLTNDDGISAPGLAALEKALSVHHDVWVVAPDVERSAQSHSITLKGPIKLHPSGFQRYACSGTPADCVMLMYRGSVLPPCDVVISGINKGPNLGTDLVYSGTAAAARQASLMGVPGLALSLASMFGPWEYEGHAAWLAENLSWLTASVQSGTYLNINFPEAPVQPLVSQWTRPSVRRYQDSLATFTSPEGDLYCFVQGFLMESNLEGGTDWTAVNQGQVALSLIENQPVVRLHPTQETP